MGSMTNRNADRGELILFLVALIFLAGLQPGCGKVQDIGELRQAAERGDAGAQNKLGIMYADGEGVAEDVQEAVKWWRKAAEQGDAQAQYTLGGMYAKGERVPQDDREAVKWYRQAAEQGNIVAQSILVRMYREGERVPQDYVKAHAWANLLASQNPGIGAAAVRDEIAAKMTPAQIAKAQQLAADLWDRIEAAKQT